MVKTCPDCGERVYKLGCVNCNEDAYIAEQEMLTDAADEPLSVDNAVSAVPPAPAVRRGDVDG